MSRVNNRGFTLIEVMIALVMVTLVIIPVANVISGATYAVIEKRNIFAATSYAHELVEEIKMKRFEEMPGVTALGRDAGETGRRNSFDDVDDYNGYRELNGIRALDGSQVDAGYRRTVTVEYVNDRDMITLSATPTNTKLVKVRCSYGRRIADEVVLTSVFIR